MNQTNTVMLGIFLALGVVLVAGLVVMPALEEAKAISSTALSKRFGQNGEIKSNGNRNGGGGINT